MRRPTLTDAWVAPVASSALATFLVFRGMGSQPLFHDEFYTLHAVERSLGEHLWEAPLLPFYALEYVWTLGGSLTSDVWMRSLSGVFVVAAVFLVSLTGHRLGGRYAAWAAGLLLALNPALQAFGQYSRPYAVGAAAFAAATYFFVQGIDSGRLSRWIAYSILILVGAILVPQGVAVVAAHLVYLVLTRASRPTFRRWAFACSPVVVLATAGLAAVALGAFSGMHEWLAKPAVLHFARGFRWLGDADVSTLGAGVAGALVILAFITPAGRAWMTGAVLGLGLIWIGSQATSFWYGQSVFPLVPLVALAAGLSLAAMGSRTMVIVLIVITVMSVPAFTELRLPGTREPDLERAVEIYLAERKPGQEVQAFGLDDAYGLLPAVRHYAPEATDVNPSTEPSAEYWTAIHAASCPTLIESWDIGYGGVLRLCHR